jgi:protein CpxP
MMSYFSRNRSWAIAFLLLIAFNIATLATFWLVREKQPMPGPAQREGVVDFLVKELGFDSVQKQKLVRLRDEHQQQMMNVRKDNRAAKDTFFALLQKDTVTDSELEKAAQASTIADQRADVLTFRHFQEIRKLCTPEQQKKFNDVLEQVLRMIGPPQPGHQPGPPPPRREGGMHDGPPPPRDGKEPPLPQQ